MIRYLARIAPVVARAALRADGRRVSRLHQRVWPTQIDPNLHMNQACYPQVFELGRADLLLRSGAWRRWRAEGINPLVAKQTITYRRELPTLARYTLDTRAVGHGGRLLHIHSHALVGDRVHAIGEVEVLFVGPHGVLGADVVAELARELVTDPLPVADWTVQRGAAGA